MTDWRYQKHCSHYSPLIGERTIVINPSVCLCVCLSASISLELLNRSSRNFVCGFPLTVARSSSGGVPLCYALPVLRMTSRLAAVQGAMPARRRMVATDIRAATAMNDVAIPGRSLVSMNACCELCLYLYLSWTTKVHKTNTNTRNTNTHSKRKIRL